MILRDESLFGSRVTRFNLLGIPGDELHGNTDINDAGQIAFHYQLANGRQGIAVATPTPEPGITASLAVGILLLGAARCRSLAG